MSEADSGFEINRVGLGTVLRNYEIQVPPNQREYEWTDREVRHYLQDLALAISEGQKDYFFGCIVTIPLGPSSLKVVDGQQRLATTAVLLSAIRDYLATIPSEKLLVDDLQDTILSTIDRKARKRLWRVVLNTSDRDYFDKRVFEGNVGTPKTSPSHDLIDKAARMAAAHVRSVVAAHAEKAHGDELNKWIEFIQHSARVILLQVHSGANAYRMFETLNDRGLRPAQADLVKNLILGYSGDRLGEAESRWIAMRTMLEQTGDDEIVITFLRHMLMVLSGFLREIEVYDRVSSKARNQQTALRLLQELEQGASDYVAIMYSDHARWNASPASRQAIRTLADLRPRALRPIMLSIVRKFPDLEAARAFRLLIDMWVRYMIVGGSRSGTTEVLLADVAFQINEGKVKNARELHKALEEAVPNDTEFQQQFAISAVSNRKLARYYLRALGQQHSGLAEPFFVPNDDQTVINLEHVLPINAHGNFPAFSPEQLKTYTNRIGNQALLQVSANSDQGNVPFAQRRAAYAACPYALTSMLGTVAGDWTPEAIDKRQAVMAALAVKTWPFAVPPA